VQLGIPIPWWGVAAIVLAAVAVAWSAYSRPPIELTGRQRTVLTALRLGVLLGVFFLLLRPLRTEPAPAGNDLAVILVDHSRSMAIPDANGRPRMDVAQEWVRDRLLPALGERFDVEVLAFGGSVSTADIDALEADAARTEIAGALDGIPARFDGRTVAGIVVVSDGVATGGRDVSEVAARLSAPVYTLGVGGPRSGPDREVAALEVGQPVGTGSAVDLRATVVSHGLGAAPFDVRLVADGRLVGVRRVRPVRDGAPTVAAFRVAPDPVLASVYTVEIPVDVAELVPGNNRRRVLVRPPERPRRLLLVEGSPGYEHSFLKRTWLADPGIAFDAVVRKGQNDRGEQTFYVQGDPERTGALASGYPRTRAALFRYDAVVLANLEAEFFRPDQLAMTAAFVSERGGGLLLLGPASLRRRGYLGSSLEPVLPVQLADRLGLRDAGRDGDRAARFVPTPSGLEHPMLRLGATVDETRSRWESAPALAGSVRIGPVRPGAAVLATTDSENGAPRPLVVVQRYGAGRSMVLAGRATWRWRMLLPADDRTYERYWGQVTRWLTAGAVDRIAVTTRGGDSADESLQVDVSVRDEEFRPLSGAAVRVRVRDSNGETRLEQEAAAARTAGEYSVETPSLSAGIHRIDTTVAHAGRELGSRRDWVLVGGADLELEDPWLDAELLRRTAEAGGGAYLDPRRLGGLADLLPAAAGSLPRLETRDVWHHAAVLMLLIALLSAEWSLRRLWGMR
jgi:uncharacterized membrane protein